MEWNHNIVKCTIMPFMLKDAQHLMRNIYFKKMSVLNLYV